MLDQHPILRERLLAAATFALILIAGAASVDFLVTNGLQWGADPKPRSAIQLTLHPGPAPAADGFAPHNRQAHAFNQSDYTRGPAGEPLEGAGDQTDARHTSASGGDEDLRRAIDDLYATAIPADGEDDSFDKGGRASEDLSMWSSRCTNTHHLGERRERSSRPADAWFDPDQSDADSCY